jgi:hypothetical protein
MGLQSRGDSVNQTPRPRPPAMRESGQAIRTLFPEAVLTFAAAGAGEAAELHPEEAACVARAGAKRRREFATGRAGAPRVCAARDRRPRAALRHRPRPALARRPGGQHLPLRRLLRGRGGEAWTHPLARHRRRTRGEAPGRADGAHLHRADRAGARAAASRGRRLGQARFQREESPRATPASPRLLGLDMEIEFSADATRFEARLLWKMPRGPAG